LLLIAQQNEAKQRQMSANVERLRRENALLRTALMSAGLDPDLLLSSSNNVNNTTVNNANINNNSGGGGGGGGSNSNGSSGATTPNATLRGGGSSGGPAASSSLVGVNKLSTSTYTPPSLFGPSAAQPSLAGLDPATWQATPNMRQRSLF
jgi:hypothetical protein